MKATKYIYFLGAREVSRVKIGCSQAPISRLEALLDYSPVPLELLAFVAGTHEDERRLHSMFRDSWSHREWFNMTPRLHTLIAFVRNNGYIWPVLDKDEIIVPLPKRKSRAMQKYQRHPGSAESRAA